MPVVEADGEQQRARGRDGGEQDVVDPVLRIRLPCGHRQADWRGQGRERGGEEVLFVFPRKEADFDVDLRFRGEGALEGDGLDSKAAGPAELAVHGWMGVRWE